MVGTTGPKGNVKASYPRIITKPRPQDTPKGTGYGSYRNSSMDLLENHTTGPRRDKEETQVQENPSGGQHLRTRGTPAQTQPKMVRRQGATQ